ncbi:MAG TPA: glutaredoxin domain-containing protein [Candidatus Saccharimonadales bacterium]|jgi:glutaredoxin-like YruB-family protein|nr:glutaredoxin domain-containing protein [Candidatus Saccharimonadales bacterium]
MNKAQDTIKNSTKQLKPIVYSTTWCGYCKMEKQYLSQKGIDFIEKDIEADGDAYRELEAKMGGAFRGVPVTDINGTIILGFDRPRIDAALNA